MGEWLQTQIMRYTGKKFMGLGLMFGFSIWVLQSLLDLDAEAPAAYAEVAKWAMIGVPVGYGLYSIGQGLHDASRETVE